MKKLQPALDEYINAKEAFSPLHQHIKTVKDRIDGIFSNNRGLVREGHQNREWDSLVEVLNNRRLQIEPKIRERLVECHEFWQGIKDQLVPVSARFKRAEAALGAELAPLVKNHTDQLTKKESDVLAQATKALRPFCETDHEAENLAWKTSAYQNAGFACSNWKIIADAVSQAKWLLKHSNQ